MEKDNVAKVSNNESGEGRRKSTWQDAYRYEVITDYGPPNKEDSDEESDDSFMTSFSQNVVKKEQHCSSWEAMMKKSQKNNATQWENAKNKMTPEELAKMFPVVQIKPPKENFESLLSYLLKQCPPLPHLEYRHYARHDGAGQFDYPIKCYKIFMTVAPEERRNIPYCISVTAHSLIQELIGLICYKYSIEYPDIGLRSVDDYGLCIAEENGEVDWAFPCFERLDPCSKFGFFYLAFVDLKYKESVSCPPEIISEIDPSEEEMTQSAIKETKTYKLEISQRLWSNKQMKMTVSYDKLDFEDINDTPRIFCRKKFSHQMDDVTDCQLRWTKNNKTSFRLTYCRSDTDSFVNAFFLLTGSPLYKHYDLECDPETAIQAVEKIKAILEMRASPRYRKYKNDRMPKQQNSPIKLDKINL